MSKSKSTDIPSYFQILAHEIGHNLNMKHDFNPVKRVYKGSDGKKVTITGLTCEEGVMSYGSLAYNKWTPCSAYDFLAHFREINYYYLDWCMPEVAIPAACKGGSTPNPTNCKHGGDSYCDDENNNAACNYDGGACCNNSNEAWNSFCTVRQPQISFRY